VDGGVTTERVRDFLRGSKDAAIAISTRTLFNTRFRLRLDLRGEAEAIEIYVKKYRLHRDGDDMKLTIVYATASRKWLEAALREFVVGQSFTIPAKAGAVLNLLT
jgi:hypothetical protein